MSASSRRSGSRQSRSRSASNISIRSSRTSSYRNAAQQTSDTGHRSPRRNSSARQRTTSPVSPHPRSPSASPSRAPNRKRFGMNVPNAVPRVPGRFDFEDKYPEDPIYEEMGPNARLWRAFLDECEVFDVDMVTESRDGLDLLLVFAGLFSAVLTTFIVQTSQALSANFPAVSSSLLVEMVQLQRAQINNTPIDDILPADTNAGPSGFDVWVNALWFTSLTLSLGTALMAVLVKQWLYQYMSMISGTARDRSLIRYYRFEGLQKWHVLTIIGILPIVLHIALGLFLAGLVVFLIPLNTPLACIVGFITLIVYTLYAVSNILPIIYIQCPYRTPFSDILNVTLRSVRTFPSLAAMRVCKLFPISGNVANPITAASHVFRTLKDAERIAATNNDVAEQVALRALLWLYELTSNPPTKRCIQESLGCLLDDVSKRSKDLQADLEQTLGEISPSNQDQERRWFRSIPLGQERRVERILRAARNPLAPGEALLVPDAVWRLDMTDTDLSFKILTSILVHAPSLTVEMDSVSWDLPSLLRHLIITQYSPTPIRLPPRLWTLVVTLLISDPDCYDHDFLFNLCTHAINSLETVAQWTDTPPSPFTGPVTMGHRTVSLFHLVVNLLVHRLGIPPATDAFNFEPFTNIFTLYDYAASKSNFDSNTSTSGSSVFRISTFAAFTRLNNICENDKPILCRRVEDVILSMPINDVWWDSRDEGMHCRYYSNALSAHKKHSLADRHSNGSEFFRKLLSDLSLSLTRDSPELLYRISTALQDLLKLHETASLYLSPFCAASFLSTPTLSSFHNCEISLYPVVSAFVEAAAAGNMRQDIVRQSLFSEPRRFYTICWILTLGGSQDAYDDWAEHRRASLHRLARIDPTHVVWQSRGHYMTLDPRDWPYLRILDDDLDREDFENISWIKQALDTSLSILEEFFVSQDTPPQKNSVPQIVSSDDLNPGTGNRHWRHIRQLVSGTRAFLGLSSASHSSPSDPANSMELGLRHSGPSGGHHAKAGPGAEPEIHVLRSTTRRSSRSSSANTARSLCSYSNSLVNVPHSNHQSLPAPPLSESPMTLPQN